jgi:Domain of unknown function (DUF4296)
MKHWFIAAITLSTSCYITGCADGPRAYGPVSDETLTRIMADMQVSQAAVTNLTGYERDSTILAYYQQIMEIHGATRETFEQSLRAAAKNPKRMEQIIKGADQLITAQLPKDSTGK